MVLRLLLAATFQWEMAVREVPDVSWRCRSRSTGLSCAGEYGSPGTTDSRRRV